MIWLIITAIGIVTAYLFTWWAIPFVALLVCLVRGERWGTVIGHSLAAGLTITGALLAITALPYGFDRYDPLSEVLMIPSSWILALITVMIGGILAGLGGAAGYSLRTITQKRSM